MFIYIMLKLNKVPLKFEQMSFNSLIKTLKITYYLSFWSILAIPFNRDDLPAVMNLLDLLG